MLTCERDIDMAVLSLKSLLRFLPELAVVVHGDESLTPDCAAVFENQIPGCRLVLAPEAEAIARSIPDVGEHRDVLPTMFESALWSRKAGTCALGMKVFDFHLSSNANRLVILDSDTLFLAPPSELIEWLSSEDSLAFHAVPLIIRISAWKNSTLQRPFPA